MRIVNEVRLRRREAGLTQEQLARLCAVSRQTIITVEAHTHTPTLPLALTLARTLGTSTDELFKIEEGPAN